MKYYLAPLQGITGFVYRNSYDKIFNNIDKYFAPFIVPNKGKSFKSKDLVDVLPENNSDLNLIPQILTNDSSGFITTSKKLQALGYNEVNLNLGCPSRMSSSKYRGSGFLALPDELDRFLHDIYQMDHIKISVKTRLGIEDPNEFYRLMEIFNKYPMEELIIHPRTQKDFYGNKPNIPVFSDALKCSTNDICYNGDIFTAADHEKFTEAFPTVKSIMVGRGPVANPGLISEIKDGTLLDKDTFRAFNDELLREYIQLCDEENHVLIKMKELWGYMGYIFSNNKEYVRNIRKSQTIKDYSSAVDVLLKEQDILEGEGLFTQGNWGV